MGREVLVVDDSPSWLKRLCSLVEEAGGEVVETARDYEEARIKLEELKPYLLLTDYVLLDGIGLDLAELQMKKGGQAIVVTREIDPAAERTRDWYYPDVLLFEKHDEVGIITAIREALGE